ncbi:uncharacterized protein CDAR_468031 [Caerostris darwini]|uniref:Uncharacterized protein n=1 Tax=Caerostris darwini TaxID=1538125 RepID=A0AAV4WUN4_9ARAC|nr:uncharacterized protein CDAR_468031 [Caerostris darwini]
MNTRVPNSETSVSRTDFTPVPTKEIDNSELEDDEDTLCGIGNFHPTWLQKFSTPKIFLVNNCILAVFQGAIFSYFVGCLSTIEKRYAFETKVSGIILMAEDVCPIVLGVFLGYFGGKSHRPRIMAFGMFIAVVSCFVMALPYFIYGPIKEFNPETLKLLNRTEHESCDAKEEDDFCKKSPTNTAVSIFFFGVFLKGFSSLAFYTLSTSYMDDIVKKKHSPVYLGIPIVFKINEIYSIQSQEIHRLESSSLGKRRIGEEYTPNQISGIARVKIEAAV